MGERLCSVGLDVGTTTTQLILSELRVENRASFFAVPEMEITDRRILYRSPVHFTPLIRDELVDGGALRELVAEEYRKAGVRREQVDTGAVIITGETSRKENAAAVLQNLAGFAGEFVVTTAGPDLESELAARGAGAVAWSCGTGKRVLHMDIGGGTSNLALVEDGVVVATGCLNVGGRLLKFDREGRITYRSPVLEGLTDLAVGDRPEEAEVYHLAQRLAAVLETAAGLRQRSAAFDQLTTKGTTPLVAGDTVLSFSGGVADCIAENKPWLAFGDMGPLLGRAIRESRLCRGAYRLGEETIRATVIGAGCHSARLSGSTVFYQRVTFPLKDLPVTAVSEERQTDPSALRAALSRQEEPGVLAIPGWNGPTYEQVTRLADAIAEAVGERPCRITLENDMAKALGVALRLRLGADREILCLDRLRLPESSYLDVGAPIGPALPVVIKTLVLDS